MKKYLSLLILTLSCSANANEINKATWISGMTSALPAAFCEPKQYFRQCFSVTAAECEEKALSVTKNCLNKYQSDLPDVLVQPRDGTHWGSIVGQCAGEAYESALIKKRISSQKCNDPANWM